MEKLCLQKKQHILVVTFYSLGDIRNKFGLVSQMQVACENENLLGTIEISDEGINCTLSGTESAVSRFLTRFQKIVPRLQIKPHFSKVLHAPFRLLKIKAKDRLVYPGQDKISKRAGTTVRASPSEWDSLFSDQNIQFLDARNSYEYRIGTFIGARETTIGSFAEFANFVAEDVNLDKKKPVAIFCTGGIRCEKASSVLNEAGFGKIIQLEGGILRYLSESKHPGRNWRGDCFVFDSRVALNCNLEPSNVTQCPNCRVPLTLTDRKEQHFEAGISCRYCGPHMTSKKRLALEERNRQRELQNSR